MNVYSYKININKELQKEVQTYPFLNSKNKKNNLDLINYIKSENLEVKKINIRNKKSKINWIEFSENKILTFHEFIQCIKKFNLDKDISKNKLRESYLSFNWKFEKINRNKNKILSLGSGDGRELIFLRLKFPEANIFAVDWQNNINPMILSKLNINFKQENIYNYLSDKKDYFDLIYSSYVLEHSYDIDVLLSLIYQSLSTNGMIVSNIPLISFVGTDYYDFLKETFVDKKVKQIDGGLIDLGHPWKTNEYDLFETLSLNKFKDIKIYGNLNQVAPLSKVNMKIFKRNAKLKFKLNKIILNPIKYLINFFYKNKINYLILRIYYRLTRNISISDNKIANYVPEVLFEAKK